MALIMRKNIEIYPILGCWNSGMRLLPKKQLRIRGRIVGGERVLLCLPLQEKKAEELYRAARLLKTFAPDIIEWRLDDFAGLEDMAASLRVVARLRAICGEVPLLLTCRAPEEGGCARELPQRERRRLLDGLIASGHIDLIDVELGSGDDFLGHISAMSMRYSVKTIFSYHNFTVTPPQEELVALLQKMEKSGADIAKLAVMPRCHRDVLALFQANLTARTSLLAIPVIAIAMGELGRISRLAAGLFGSDITFAHAAGASAPGQLHIADMQQMMPFFY